ncbi:MAG: hypothetical protein ACJA1R_002059 [Flavobacteriales bacterium]|jgi:hypothetical protein
METSDSMAVTRPHELAPRAAIAQYQDKSLSEGDLLRAIMSHPTWTFASTEKDGRPALGVLVREDGGRVLELFSDDDALGVFRATHNEQHETWHALEGHLLFAALGEQDAHRINLDPASEHAFRYQFDQLGLLRAWANVAAVELALLAPERFANPFAVLRRFAEYHVLLRLDGENRDWVLAPDQHERMLAAVFTAPDTADEFVTAMSEHIDGELVLDMVSGEDLFRSLQQYQFDGVVMNPLSHLPPVALSTAVAEKVLATARQ